MSRRVLAAVLLFFAATELNSQERVTRWRITVQFAVPKGYLPASFQWAEVCRAASVELAQQGYETTRCALEGVK